MANAQWSLGMLYFVTSVLGRTLEVSRYIDEFSLCDTTAAPFCGQINGRGMDLCRKNAGRF